MKYEVNDVKIARCTKNNHVMRVKNNNRDWTCDGGKCGDEPTTNKDYAPNVLIYSCEECKLDYCP